MKQLAGRTKSGGALHGGNYFVQILPKTQSRKNMQPGLIKVNHQP
jgi:hypothetical protein